MFSPLNQNWGKNTTIFCQSKARSDILSCHSLHPRAPEPGWSLGLCLRRPLWRRSFLPTFAVTGHSDASVDPAARHHLWLWYSRVTPLSRHPSTPFLHWGPAFLWGELVPGALTLFLILPGTHLTSLWIATLTAVSTLCPWKFLKLILHPPTAYRLTHHPGLCCLILG